jgi:hypothetical protein
VTENYAKSLAERGGSAVAVADSTDVAKTPEQLQADEVSLRKLYDAAKKELDDLGQRCTEIAQLQADADAVKIKLDETAQRIDQLTTESQAEGRIQGRITIENAGDMPLAPSKDKRLAFAGAGATALGGRDSGSCCSSRSSTGACGIFQTCAVPANAAGSWRAASAAR